MDKHETQEITDLIKAYEQIGGLLMSRLKRHVAVIPGHMGAAVTPLLTHTSLMHHIVSNVHENIVGDVPVPNGDKYEVGLSCNIHFTVEGVATRQEAVDQVESGYYDEYIGTLVATAAKEGQFRKVKRIRPVDEEEEGNGT